MKAGRKPSPEICPYLGWKYESMRSITGMSDEDVVRMWAARRQAARAAGFSPHHRGQLSSKRCASAWMSSGIDNPFQSEEAFRIRLGVALRGALPAEGNE